MKDPSNTQLQRDGGRTEGYYHYNATEPGIHKYCFTNGPDVKTISLYPHSYKDTSNDWKEAGNSVDTAKLDEEFYNLEGLVDQVSSIRQALISRSFTIDKANRSITSRVYWWSIFQGILLVVVCGWQVVQIKKFFDTRRLV
ncbi:hypothetical protein CONCODRAFT_79651 [Conidiobolus coronatus NRRL 28638]|uniref:GOLD domain-containing protein n=1 Tax=Conidiobolus coronatus (strain ATCC 28846 / CBS 209.66 / NRRL 28638) TaxID=796925 RepID=A0A137P137_CONC2|nr:hypothetical protein CONCODRAFT_79651 [Conidiobolus coronatus NRRL 28638]|eukprot:KXN68786.1 hypothetical protein CONCODRAFT_79651 [Conidiobolus coronatus NRRL 28638]